MGSGGGSKAGGNWWPTAGECARKMGKLFKFVKDDAINTGKEDPRKLIHSVKVGLALTLASLLYLLEPVFNGLGGQNSIWAVITVIVVLEFTDGATLYKGINRGLGTVLAISMAFLIELFVHHVGHIGRAICIGLAVFTVGSVTTYARLIPSIQKHSDYGLVVFVLTFNMIAVGSYHDRNVLHTAIQRLYTIGIGCVICLITSLLILPNWSGEELHRSIISKFEELAKMVQGLDVYPGSFLLGSHCSACVDEYFQDVDKKDTSKSSMSFSMDTDYEEILKCNAKEFALATFASWEPRHSRYLYPWKKYAHLGVELRHLGYTAVALHGCLGSHIQAPQPVRAMFREPCKHVAEEVVHVLRELAETIKTHHLFSPHISDHLHEALEELDASIKTQPQLLLASTSMHKFTAWSPVELIGWQEKKPHQHKDVGENMNANRAFSKTVVTRLQFSEALSLAAFVSLLVETAARLEMLIEEVEELGKVAHFEELHEEQKEIEIVITNENLDLKEASDDSENSQGTNLDSMAHANWEKKVTISTV